MGYKSLIQGLVQDAITKQIGDLKNTAVFKMVVTGAYDAVTGSSAVTETEYTVQCLLTNIHQDDEFIDYSDHLRNMAGIAQTMRKALVPYLQLEGVDVDSLDDEVIVDDVPYNILQAKIDPSGSLYTFFLKSKGAGDLAVG